MSEEIMSADALLRENAELRAQLDYVMRALDMEHARMAALIEACEVFAAFVESYDDRSMLATALPTTYANLRVYGKNARAAVEAVRPQADALLAELAAARAVVAAMREIDKHVVGAYASDTGGMPEPCDECSEMREIASQALNDYDKAMKARTD